MPQIYTIYRQKTSKMTNGGVIDQKSQQIPQKYNMIFRPKKWPSGKADISNTVKKTHEVGLNRRKENMWSLL